MKKMSITITMLLIWVCGSIYAQTPAAEDILKNADAVVNAPKDQEITLEMILIDKKGKEKKRVAKMWQKGSEKRMIKFLLPADVKGLGFLDLPDDIMYLYLPAFKKIRRIASHVKNTSFAGTDFTYDDMASINYTDEYDPKLIGTKKEKGLDHYLLELIPKKGIKKDYSKLVMWVRKDNFYPVKIEHYDKAGKLWKVMDRKWIKKEGKYWIAKEAKMTDLKKEHRTKMLIIEVKFDQDLKDEFFSQRYLKRREK
ncbi:MAG: outer membrane lipoprotein-sorting protein [Candidatus Cloacimonetes bacterium]|nr:outer membrane lipoprotein-sorting protein [Candidatus Cloacimonadota bacterium]MCK4358567.1 outer membrane lipoprotein-sorting protein [Candidatus Cloacimonadota bacterium]